MAVRDGTKARRDAALEPRTIALMPRSPLPPLAASSASAPFSLRGSVPVQDGAFARGADVDRSVLATDVHLFSAPPVVDRSALICYRCGEVGHVKGECMSWRIRLCTHFAGGYCRRSECPYAHGDTQLRTPWALKCVRILKVAKGFVDFGCGSSTHSFRHCPHTRKIEAHLLPRANATPSAASAAAAAAADATRADEVCHEVDDDEGAGAGKQEEWKLVVSSSSGRGGAAT